MKIRFVISSRIMSTPLLTVELLFELFKFCAFWKCRTLGHQLVILVVRADFVMTSLTYYIRAFDFGNSFHVGAVRCCSLSVRRGLATGTRQRLLRSFFSLPGRHTTEYPLAVSLTYRVLTVLPSPVSDSAFEFKKNCLEFACFLSHSIFFADFISRICCVHGVTVVCEC